MEATSSVTLAWLVVHGESGAAFEDAREWALFAFAATSKTGD